MSCYCDHDPPDGYEERLIKKARKEHRCEECRHMIEKGEPYTLVSVCYSGEGWSSTKFCEYCWHDWEYLRNAGHCISFGCLEESWAEHWENERSRYRRDGYVSVPMKAMEKVKEDGEAKAPGM